jgi:hypothetical protein
MFGRIARELHDDFMQNAPSEIREALTGHLQQAQEILKTARYREFEAAITAAFHDQLRRTTHGVTLDFRTFDPLNFYKSLQPFLRKWRVEESDGSGSWNTQIDCARAVPRLCEGFPWRRDLRYRGARNISSSARTTQPRHAI